MDDYIEAITGGPWVILDAYLSVARWKPDFNLKQEKVDSVVAWVRFPNLPAPLFDKKFLLNLGNSIRKAIRLDVHTVQRSKGRFARMCVELDLNKPLIPEFSVEGQKISVVYESLGQICNNCGRVGHSKGGCEAFHKKMNEGSMLVDGIEENESNGEGKENGANRWKTVQRARRPRRQDTELQKKQSGSRFSVLQEDSGEAELIRSETMEQGPGLKSVGVERGMGKGIAPKQTKKGVTGGGKGHIKENEVSFSKSTGKVEQESKKEKELQLNREKIANKHGSERVVLSQNFHAEDTHMESERHDFSYVHKENLKPGDSMGVIQANKVGDPMNCQPERGGVQQPDGASRHMNEVVWNSRGAASKGVTSLIRDVKFRYKLDMVVILEPRISGRNADRVIKSWGFRHSVRMEAEGFSGGIWLLWELDDLIVDVKIMDEQFIHCKLHFGGEEMLFTAVYASPLESKRCRLWELLHRLSCEVAEPWFLAGDFNEIKTPREQQGGGRVNEARCHRFNEWIEDCSLIDIEAQEPFFTWKGPKWKGLERVYKRLDRCLCTGSWHEKFEEAKISVLPRICSDHHPLLIQLSQEYKGKRQRFFKYEAMWKMHDMFDSVLESSWRRAGESHSKLVALQRDLIMWNKEVFGKLEGRKRRLYDRLRGGNMVGIVTCLRNVKG
ncbi:hypothetical protein K1719_037966 [Acacia pycnantha]|nr:hypothetical protein K1719_037966 [Acacia pycnantha]